MKNYYLVILFFSIILFSCSSESEPLLENNFEKLNEVQKTETLLIAQTKYIFEKSNTLKVVNGIRNYSFKFQTPTEYKGTLISEKNLDDQFLLENPDTDEFILIKNLVQEDKNIVAFEFITSNSNEFISAKYKGDKDIIVQDNKCPLCVIVAIEVIDALIEFSSDDYDSNCKAAIDSCGPDGPSEVNLSKGGWFSSDTCTVKC